GFIVDSATGKDYNNENHYVIRPAFTYKTDTVENYFMFQYFYERNNGQVANLMDYAPATCDPTVAGCVLPSYAVMSRTGALTKGYAANNAILDQLMYQSYHNPYVVNGYVIQQGFSGNKKREILMINNTNWDVTDNISIRNIFEFRKNGYRGY